MINNILKMRLVVFLKYIFVILQMVCWKYSDSMKKKTQKEGDQLALNRLDM